MTCEAEEQQLLSTEKVVKYNDPASKPPPTDDPFGAAYLFKYIIFSQIVVYFEAGAVPSLLAEFTETFHLDPQGQGLLGAVVYFALSIGSPLCGYLFKNYSPRLLLGYSLILNNAAMLVFAFMPVGYSWSVFLLIFVRGIIGFTQAFLCVYSPLWVHEFAPKHLRTTWMSYLQGAIPIGISIGYLLGTISVIFSKQSEQCGHLFCWRLPFVSQFILVIPLCIAIFYIPDKHIQMRLRRRSIVIVDEEEDMDEDGNYDDNRANVEQQDHFSSGSILQLLKIPVYTSVVLGLSGLFFVVSGVQYWTTLYLVTNTTQSKSIVHILYLVVSSTGPILGVFFGGWLIDNAGGYAGTHNEANALQICSVLGTVACLSAIPPSFLSNSYYIGIFLWVMLFCGGAILPPCSGIVISCAPRELRPLAASVAYTAYNLLGYAASNYIPGFVMDRITSESCGKACTYRIGFRIVLLWSCVAVFALGFAWLYSRNKSRSKDIQTSKKMQKV